MKFWKVESVGNHFPLVLNRDVADPVALALQMCANRYGVGGDGLLVWDGETGTLRMFNPDGTDDFCGNGLRCAAHWTIAHEDRATPFVIRHLGREVAVTTEGGEIATVLGRATYCPAAVPHRGPSELFRAPFGAEASVSAISTGSTHLVAHVAELPTDDFEARSRALENDPFFPDRTSVMWTQDDGPDLRLRIWERGVGETFGCGSGASAAAADRMRRDGVGREIRVRMPGGSITITAEAWDASLTVRGVARTVYEGDWPA